MNVNILTKTPIKKPILCFALLLWLTSANARNIEELDNIRATAESYALSQVDNNGLKNIEAHAISIDSRLKLEKCELPLEASASTKSRNVARATVKVSCTGSKPWSLYVPVNINATAQVVYTMKHLVRGETLSIGDMEIREIELNKLPANYLNSIEQFAGMEITRSVKPGSVLTLNTLRIRKIIQRGQEVVILAKSNSVQVRMTGIALKNGAFGELIPIRNVKSGRTIEATILNESTVTVNM